ncbi:hypothetical protein SE15_12300 [Thermanaerothrix daxensis]|uniref:Protein-glutamine gamma-glutamyltransferase-like C-terminal domain-containing protein n=1 Tax=Thermanaerothrix daxensis TaxID=869279 RepID=A0A0N8GQ64_9CHLR|nr:DUF4129 domain-containing protein [Thermanaerothrix daxensis]KPL82826.1 hypothetical protein SE15_12300 [Thermanaerothrix daxensis]
MTLLHWAEVGILFEALAEVVWATLWYCALVQPTQGPGWVALALLAVILGAERLSRWLDRRRERLAPWGAIVAMTGFILVAVGMTGWLFLREFSETLFELFSPGSVIHLKGEWGRWGWHVAAMLLLTWRGVRLGKLRIDSDGAVASLRLGILMLLLYGVFQGVRPTLTAMWPAFLLLALNLSSIGILRMVDLFQSRGGAVPIAALPWWFFIVGMGVALALLGVGVGAFLERPAEWLSWAIMALVGIPLVVVAFVFGAVVLLLVSWLIPLLTGGTAVPLPDIVGGEKLPKFVEQLLQGVEPTSQWPLIDRLLPGLALLAILGLLALVMIELRSPGTLLLPLRAKEGMEERLPLSRLARGLRRSRGRRTPLNRMTRQHIANRIRAIYQHLLDLAAALEHPRPPAVTPLEFLPVLKAMFPDHLDALEMLTYAYIQVRYGEIPEDPRVLERVEQAWESLAEEGARRLQAKAAEGSTPKRGSHAAQKG